MPQHDRPRAAAILRAEYKAAAAVADWQRCLAITESMRGLERRAGAEVEYALGFAHEQLGDVTSAKRCYETVIRIDARHERARRRLAALAALAAP